MYIWTHAKHVWNDGAAATAREAQLHAKQFDAKHDSDKLEQRWAKTEKRQLEEVL